MSKQQPAHPSLTDQEMIIAFIAGTGLTLMMLAGGIAALGTTDASLTGVAIVGLVLIAFAAGLWYLMLKPYEDFDDLKEAYFTGHAHDDHHHVAVDAPVATAQIAEPLVIPDKPDNLRLIEGIGPKTEQALNAAGISTFAELAMKTSAEIDEILAEQKVRVVASTETWAIQARVAATGDANELDELKTRIKDGYLHDDLTQIEGVGEKVQQALYDAGIRTYQNLVDADATVVDQALKTANVPVPANTLQKQAQFLAAGDLAGLKRLQDEIKGGRE